MKTVIITQARVGSSRLPAKVLKKINNQTLLEIHLSRLKKSELADEIVVATTHEEGSEKICAIAETLGIKWYQGDLNDVLDRFYNAANSTQAQWVVRVTSDCPLIDPKLIDLVIQEAQNGDYDYCSNVLTEDFPDGQDVEVFKKSALEEAWKNAKRTSEREHVTPYIRLNTDVNGGNRFKAKDIRAPENFNAIRMTVDEPLDFEVIAWLINEKGTSLSWMEYVEFMLNHPNRLVNKEIIRNEGYLKSKQED